MKPGTHKNLVIKDDSGAKVLALGEVVISKEPEPDTFKVTGQLSLKEILLFHLWQAQQHPVEGLYSAAQVQHAAGVFGQLIDRIWFDGSENPTRPKLRYDLADFSRIQVEFPDQSVEIPDRSDLPAYAGFLHQLIQELFYTEPTKAILAMLLRLYIEQGEGAETEAKPSKTKEQKREQIAPAGGEFDLSNLKFGLHMFFQFFGSGKPFDPQIPISWEKQYGTPIDRKIDRYGVDLTDFQLQIVEGILRGFNETRYRGNTTPKTMDEVKQEFPALPDGELPSLYDNISEIPRLQVQQRELMRLCGVNENNHAEYSRTIEALRYLVTTPFCFYYTRMVRDKDGKPQRDSKTGDIVKEEVQGISTLFTYKETRDPQTKEFKYYEIEPSTIFLDQIETYFLLIPYGWREDVRKKVGTKRSSSYTMLFLLYLRYRFEQCRPKTQTQAQAKTAKNPYELRMPWVEVAQALRMPESVYNRQRARAIKIIDQTYQVALELGYLSSYSREGNTDILVLNPEGYHVPEKTPAAIEAARKPNNRRKGATK